MYFQTPLAVESWSDEYIAIANRVTRKVIFHHEILLAMGDR